MSAFWVFFFLLSALPTMNILAGDKITFKNGTMIRGDILGYNAGGDIRVGLSDGTVLTNKSDDVLTIEWDQTTVIAPSELTNKAKRFLFLLNPAGFIYDLAKFDSKDVDLEIQLSMSKHLSLFFRPQVGFVNKDVLLGLEGGLIYMPFGKFMDGLFIKAGIGGAGMPSDYRSINEYGFIIAGYQFVFNFGLSLELGVGLEYRAYSQYYVTDVASRVYIIRLDIAKIGWAF